MQKSKKAKQQTKLAAVGIIIFWIYRTQYGRQDLFQNPGC